jgi:hypothetical protein
MAGTRNLVSLRATMTRRRHASSHALRTAEERELITETAMTSRAPLLFRALGALDGPWGSWGAVAARTAELGCAARAGRSLVRYLAAEPTLARARARVELGGRDYLDPAMETRDDVPFQLAAAAVCDASDASGASSSAAPGGPGIYVAQSPTPPELDALCAGLAPLLRARDAYGRNVWLGPAGTVTPLHRDPNANLLAQVVGRKRVILHHPDARVYPRSTAPHTNASAADAEAPGDAFPDFPPACEIVELGPGDALLIPVGWWHHVRCTAGPSLSLNYWFR